MKYVITLTNQKIGTDTVVYHIRRSDEADWQATSVWVDTKREDVRCCSCSTILTAMSASCKHALAVKKHLKKQKEKSQKQPLKSTVDF